jgi:hypothetical protein
MPPPPLTFGVDGCKGGWIAATAPDLSSTPRFVLFERFTDLAAGAAAADGLALVDIPIGLADGRRACDGKARKLLGPRRACSVFTPPSRSALAGTDGTEIRRLNIAATGRSLSSQCLGILRKIAEADAVITPALQRHVREAHPECAFAALTPTGPGSPSRRSPPRGAAAASPCFHGPSPAQRRPLRSWRARSPRTTTSTRSSSSLPRSGTARAKGGGSGLGRRSATPEVSRWRSSTDARAPRRPRRIRPTRRRPHAGFAAPRAGCATWTGAPSPRRRPATRCTPARAPRGRAPSARRTRPHPPRSPARGGSARGAAASARRRGRAPPGEAPRARARGRGRGPARRSGAASPPRRVPARPPADAALERPPLDGDCQPRRRADQRRHVARAASQLGPECREPPPAGLAHVEHRHLDEAERAARRREHHERRLAGLHAPAEALPRAPTRDPRRIAPLQEDEELVEGRVRPERGHRRERLAEGGVSARRVDVRSEPGELRAQGRPKLPGAVADRVLHVRTVRWERTCRRVRRDDALTPCSHVRPPVMMLGWRKSLRRRNTVAALLRLGLRSR